MSAANVRPSEPDLAVAKKRPRDGKSPYSAAQIKEWESKLIAKRAELAGRVQDVSTEALADTDKEPSSDNAADFGTDSYHRNLQLSLLEGSAETLREIDDALTRIRDGTYGVCVECGSVIHVPRLDYLPQTAVCIHCAD